MQSSKTRYTVLLYETNIALIMYKGETTIFSPFYFYTYASYATAFVDYADGQYLKRMEFAKIDKSPHTIGSIYDLRLA